MKKLTVCKNPHNDFEAGKQYEVEYHEGYCLVFGDTFEGNIFETIVYAYPRYSYFFDYFYDVKELRRLKLKEINEKNN